MIEVLCITGQGYWYLSSSISTIFQLYHDYQTKKGR